jgi:hypothetical protein
MQKVQSVVFRKPNYDLNKSANWIHANHFQIKKVDETKETFRFRQFAPQALRKEGYNKYKTMKVDDDISLVIAFKEV